MLTSIWNFIKKHRKKVIFTGIIVSGVVLLGRYARKKFLQLQETEAAEVLAHAKKQHHFDSNQRTCNMTVLSMLPSLREALTNVLDSDTMTAKLRTQPENKIEIWEELKIICFARSIVAVYSSCLLIIMLRVQLNIVGGYMYLDSLTSSTGGNGVIVTPDIQKRYLASIQYLLNQGLSDMANQVKQEVQEALKDVTLRQQITMKDTQELITRVRQQVEMIYGETGSNLNSFLLPEEHIVEQSGQSAALTKLLQETRDMLESSDFYFVLKACLDTGFSRLLDKAAEYFKPTPQPNASGPSVSSFEELSMPLAKVIPIMNGLPHTLCCDAPNPIIQELLLKDEVKDFSANVYEAFTQTEPTVTQVPGME